MISTTKFLVDVFDNGANGNGVAKQDGLVCFVPYSIAGEKVLVHANQFAKNYCECSLDEVVVASHERTKARCSYFEKCGGCQLQHMSQNAQLNFKTNQLKSILTKALKKTIDVLPCICENEFGYRNKVNFQIVDDTLCFSDNNQKFFPVKNCLLFEKDLTEIIQIVNAFLKSTQTNFRAFHVRILDEVFQFTFVSNSFDFPHSKHLISNFLQKNINFSLNLCKNESISSSNITDDVICVYGEKEQSHSVLGIQSKVSPASFLQVNKLVQNKIYEDINSQILANSLVINAYGGTGILSGVLSKKARRVYSVEINKATAHDCENLIKTNNLKNVISICGDCKNEIPKLLQKEKISHIVFDPPRNGIHKNILDLILKLDISNIIYLSCNPSTLARDLNILSKKYEIARVQPYDMFPQTHHVETLVTLTNKNFK